MPTDQPLSITDAARWSGLTSRTLRRHIDAGRLPARNTSAEPHSATRMRYRIDVDDLRAFMANRPDTPKLHKARYVTRAELAGFLERRDQPVARVGYDLTLTTEKSVSVLAMLADGHVRDTIVEAIDTANRVAIDYLERNAAWTRKQTTTSDGDGGATTVASFLHGTSRALDPFLHRHNVVANSTVDADGNTKTLDATHFYRHAPAAAALASARLRAELTTRLGVRFTQSPTKQSVCFRNGRTRSVKLSTRWWTNSDMTPLPLIYAISLRSTPGTTRSRPRSKNFSPDGPPRPNRQGWTGIGSADVSDSPEW